MRNHDPAGKMKEQERKETKDRKGKKEREEKKKGEGRKERTGKKERKGQEMTGKARGKEQNGKNRTE